LPYVLIFILLTLASVLIFILIIKTRLLQGFRAEVKLRIKKSCRHTARRRFAVQQKVNNNNKAMKKGGQVKSPHLKRCFQTHSNRLFLVSNYETQVLLPLESKLDP